MALIRKARAGSDSFGHVWPEDGAVIEIDDPDQIAALMAIDDAGFSEVTASHGDSDDSGSVDSRDDSDSGADGSSGDGSSDTGGTDDDDSGDDGKGEVSEIDPGAPAGEPEAKPAPRRTAAKRPGRKPAAQDVQE